VIAHFAEATKPKLRQMPDEVTRFLADLVARRRQIVEMIAAEAQRTRRMSNKRLTKSVARLRKALEKAGRLDRRSDTGIGRLGRERGSPRFRARRGKDNRPDSKVTFAKLGACPWARQSRDPRDRKTPITATDLLNDRVVPFFDEKEVKLSRVLTDRGTENCGNPGHHEYELYLAVENIDHSRGQDEEPTNEWHR
jgi:hypothetical protein